jgi:hypothetical protein
VPTSEVSAAPLSDEDVNAIARVTTVYIAPYDEVPESEEKPTNEDKETARRRREEATLVQLDNDLDAREKEFYDAGSGVIIARKENVLKTNEGTGGIEKNYTYYVLTNYHVVKDTDNKLFGIRTYDRRLHSFNLGNRPKEPNLNTYFIETFGHYLPQGEMEGLDLSLIQFTSSQDYQIAAMPPQGSDPIKPGERLIISGWPTPINPLDVGRVRRSSMSQVIQLDPNEVKKTTGGYNVQYNPVTEKDFKVAVGMSGGPVFNMKGELVGIHGASYPSVKETPEYLKQSTNGGFAINIQDFRKNVKQKDLTFQSSPVAPNLIALGKKNPESADQMKKDEKANDPRPEEPDLKAVKDLNDKCGALGKYSDGTLRPDASMVRAAGAVALNTCIDQVTIAPIASKEDLDALKQRLQIIQQQLDATKLPDSTSKPSSTTDSPIALAVANQTFVCNQDPSAPATLANTANGSRTMIRWASQYFTSSGYDPKLRCQQVSARMEKLRQERKLQFITSGVMNQQPVVCAALTQQDAKERRCTGGLILTLEKGDDSRAVVKQLEDAMASNSTLVKQLKLPAHKGYADLREFLD